MRRFQYLWQQFVAKTASDEELDELFLFIADPSNSSVINEVLEKIGNREDPVPDYDPLQWQYLVDAALSHSKEKLTAETQPALNDPHPPGGAIPMRRFHFVRSWGWAAAAAVLLLFGGAVYLFLRQGTPKAMVIASPLKDDVPPPAINKATITLANGEKVFLDKAANGTLAVQGITRITKGKDGDVVYDPANKKATMLAGALNTLYNPRGSRVVSITLSDGTRVWLNAESSLTFPVNFTGTDRKVSVLGEAYFEVSHNASKPFTVTNGNNVVSVLGTRFDINAYGDEGATQVTLLEGSIQVSQLNSRHSRLIGPGQQVSIIGQPGGLSRMKVREDADLDKVMAWKNGIFNFNRESITDIMLQLRRWYDIDILYQGDQPTDLFSGIIRRDNNISRVLKLFEQTNQVHFKIEGGKVMVMK